MRTGDTQPTAKQLLDQELERRGLSVRALARLIAGTGADDKTVEKHRRALNRIVNEDKTPKDETASPIEAALEKPAGWLPRFDPGRRSGAGGAAEMKALRESLQALEGTVAILAAAVVQAGLLSAEDLPPALALPPGRKAASSGRGARKR